MILSLHVEIVNKCRSLLGLYLYLPWVEVAGGLGECSNENCWIEGDHFWAEKNPGRQLLGFVVMLFGRTFGVYLQLSPGDDDPEQETE